MREEYPGFVGRRRRGKKMVLPDGSRTIRTMTRRERATGGCRRETEKSVSPRFEHISKKGKKKEKDEERKT